MKATLNWNHERWRTRDRLIEYDFNIVPPHPHTAGIPFIYPLEDMNLSPMIPLMENSPELPVIYPWEDTSMSLLVIQLYNFASESGYTGTIENFREHFGYYLTSGGIQIIFDNFPATGDHQHLYFDTNSEILYCWDDREGYTPVNAMLIANTILNCGDSTT